MAEKNESIEMVDKMRYELNKLEKKDNVETEEAIVFLKKVSKVYLIIRGAHLHKKERKEAKAIHDELADIYLKIAKKLSDEEVKQSLNTFAFYWLRSGETEAFIEPSLPKMDV